jgi:SNF2 family DNA or RNA helicase
MITIATNLRDPGAVLLSTDSPGTDAGAWSRIRGSVQRGITGGNETTMSVSLDVFVSELQVLREVRTQFNAKLTFDNDVRQILNKMGNERLSRENVALKLNLESTEKIADDLAASHFLRELRSFQLANLSRLIALPHGADFSVPGAGKTTVALANFALHRRKGIVSQLLVVAPVTAFETWREEATACFEKPPVLSIHTLGSAIPATTDILLTNYHRLSGDYATLRSWVSRRSTQIVLDEAHRMKRGRRGVHGRAALDLAFSAARRDILTGTPTPQGANDLVPLITYLYPGQERQILPSGAFDPSKALDETVLKQSNQAVTRFFVRTRKRDLDLPPTKIKSVVCPMPPLQRAIYEAIVGKYRGQFQMAIHDRHQLRRLGRVVMYLLEAASNPHLLPAGSTPDDPVPFHHPPMPIHGDEPLMQLLQSYGTYERPWKYDFVKMQVKTAHAQGKKTLIWTNFVRSISFMAADLVEFSPAIVHGGIPPADVAPRDALRTREQELNRFRNDPKCAVLLANPATAGEGISLHHWCHHAIYVDRTFNAGHFLQSQDRIHRLGLAPNTETTFTLLISEGTVDTTVDSRLGMKVKALALLLDDPDLVRISLPTEDPDDDQGSPTFDDDSAAVCHHLDGV